MNKNSECSLCGDLIEVTSGDLIRCSNSKCSFHFFTWDKVQEEIKELSLRCTDLELKNFELRKELCFMEQTLDETVESDLENGKHIFSLSRSDGSRVKITTSDEVTWPELTREFVHYLRGCGFIFTDESFVDRVEEMFS